MEPTTSDLQTVSTPEQLDSVPVGRVLRDRRGTLVYVTLDAEGSRRHVNADFRWFPMTVLPEHAVAA